MFQLKCGTCNIQGWGQVQYLYLSTYLSVLEYLVYGNVKVLAVTFQVQFVKKCKCSELLEYIIITVTILGTNYR